MQQFLSYFLNHHEPNRNQVDPQLLQHFPWIEKDVD